MAGERPYGLVAPRQTRATLTAQCVALGLVPGDTVMVHASLRAVGEVLGGPDELIEALLAAVGAAGTVLVYVGGPSPFDDVGRGMYAPADEAFVLEHCPPFDPRHTRASRDFGALAELFRSHPRAVCSAAVGARMAAIGAAAEELTRDHGPDYGLGVGSPLERLCRRGGKVMLVGSDPDNTTLLHYAEAVAPIADKRVARVRVPLVGADGRREWREVAEYDSAHGVRDWPDRLFARVVEGFVAGGGARVGALGGARTVVFRAQALVDFAVPILVETAARLDASGTGSG
jgi:aminoglycoside 3-N-acetyltransferase